MALDKPYQDIPGTTIFDADMARKGFHLNQFCMSLMKAENRERFKADQRAYLDEWPMTEEQKQAVLERDYNRMMVLGGNIYLARRSWPCFLQSATKWLVGTPIYAFEVAHDACTD